MKGHYVMQGGIEIHQTDFRKRGAHPFLGKIYDAVSSSSVLPSPFLFSISGNKNDFVIDPVLFGFLDSGIT
uniref:Uncharacterized protein n=1 Tax=Nelumbo nucifera TaxID=4432 RepID=A0A822ZT71_NELNU|nr:TPA_asm: hypothetical protein HUJ06_016502 [Nelumbo nucifera]